jgi:hypothetical protein
MSVLSISVISATAQRYRTKYYKIQMVPSKPITFFSGSNWPNQRAAEAMSTRVAKYKTLTVPPIFGIVLVRQNEALVNKYVTFLYQRQIY